MIGIFACHPDGRRDEFESRPDRQQNNKTVIIGGLFFVSCIF